MNFDQMLALCDVEADALGYPDLDRLRLKFENSKAYLKALKDSVDTGDLGLLEAVEAEVPLIFDRIVSLGAELVIAEGLYHVTENYESP